MGFPIKFNWVLQFDSTDIIETGKAYPFTKDGNRVFPIDTTIDLISSDRQAVAKIRIKWFSNSQSATTGEFEVVKVYSGEEKIILSKYWMEND